MKYKIIFLLYLLSACTTNSGNFRTSTNFQPYSSKGFALIYNFNDYKNKIINKKLDNDKFQIAHSKLGMNKTLILSNPANNKSIELKVTKKAKYPNFFNILITEKVSDELALNKEFPFIEVHQRIKNKSFVAKKAEIYTEERNVSDKAPVTKIIIDNISKMKSNQSVIKKKKKSFSIIIGEFYSKKSAQALKLNLVDKYVNKEHLNVIKLGKNRFELSAGPYLSINTLKNDYFELNKYGFEDLDIKQND